MLKNSKALTIGLPVLAIVCASVFFLVKAPGLAGAATTDAPAAAEKVAAPAPAPATPPAADKPAPASSAATAAPPAADSKASSKPGAIDVDAATKDRVLGKDSAPVTIIEYASLTCPHCAHFDKEILPEVKKRLIDTGKAKLIFRDFPFDRFAIAGAMMARCLPADKYYDMIDVLFTNQDRWTKAKDPMEGLAQLGSLAGMDDASFKACTENHDLENAILKHMQDAQTQYKVQSTPTFVFNDGAEQFSGAQDVDKFEATVDKLTKGK